MSQFGMQMPGAQRTRGPAMNSYTGMMLIAVVCLGAAIGFAVYAGMKVGPGSGPMAALKLHPAQGKIQLAR
jgi:hypothetical protein